MHNNFASLVTDSGMLIFLNDKQYTVPNDHPNFSKIQDAMVNGKYHLIPDMIDIRASVHKWINSGKSAGFRLENDLITLNGDPFSFAVTDKVLGMIEAGAPAEPLFAFLRKVRQNPSKTAQDELLMFCVANGFMIHEDGDILAYKSVREDYKDIHSGTFDNSVGKVVEMSRHKVDDRRNVTCSHGLHFAAFKYVSESFTGAHIMIIKVNPKDVVSIPEDYHNQKGRCARYEVIGEIGDKQPLPKKQVYTNADVRGTTKTAEVNELKRKLEHKIKVHKKAYAEYEHLIDTEGVTSFRDSGCQCNTCTRIHRLDDLLVSLVDEADDVMNELDNLGVTDYDTYFTDF